jgi:hypothetical protein
LVLRRDLLLQQERGTLETLDVVKSREAGEQTTASVTILEWNYQLLIPHMEFYGRGSTRLYLLDALPRELPSISPTALETLLLFFS